MDAKIKKPDKKNQWPFAADGAGAKKGASKQAGGGAVWGEMDDEEILQVFGRGRPFDPDYYLERVGAIRFA
jgi:hypothetical protein